MHWAAALGSSFLLLTAAAQADDLVVSRAPVTLAADLDDDDEDGTVDGAQASPPLDDLQRLVLRGEGPFAIAVTGPLSLVLRGKRSTSLESVARGEEVWLSAAAPGEGSVRVQSAAGAVEMPVRVLALQFLDGQNRPLVSTRDALGISRHITHDTALPRGQRGDETSDDPDAFRLELALSSARPLFARLEARSQSATEPVRVLRHIPLTPGAGGRAVRSPMIRLVSDSTDESAPGVSGQLLRVRLRDRVDAVVVLDGRELRVSARVGRPGRDGGPRAALQGRLRIAVLRSSPSGPPVLGADEAEALALARSQVEIANEIWAQCFVGFGPPEASEVRLVAPPPPALLAIGDIDGLPARGDGAIVFRANGVRIGPLRTRAAASPETTARDVARALGQRGFSGEVSINPRTEPGAGPSADLVVRDARGALATLSVDAAAPLSTDAQQRVAIGAVDLSDGIQEFDNALAAAGTLEERTLLKLLIDRDPTTIDVLLINHFVNRDRQGEAFIEADGSSTSNALIFDRNAVRYDRQAWVQAHELGHVLLDEAFHPDSIGSDQPWLLMDADAQRGRVTGPKRLRPEDCARVRRRSGPGAHPVLLAPAP